MPGYAPIRNIAPRGAVSLEDLPLTPLALSADPSIGDASIGEFDHPLHCALVRNNAGLYPPGILCRDLDTPGRECTSTGPSGALPACRPSRPPAHSGLHAPRVPGCWYPQRTAYQTSKAPRWLANIGRKGSESEVLPKSFGSFSWRFALSGVKPPTPTPMGIPLHFCR